MWTVKNIISSNLFDLEKLICSKYFKSEDNSVLMYTVYV